MNHIEILAGADGKPGQKPQLVNLSPGSLIVRPRKLLEPGAPVSLTIRFSQAAATAVHIDAEVVWVNAEQGDMALRFMTIDERGREAIAGYLAGRAGSGRRGQAIRANGPCPHLGQLWDPEMKCTGPDPDNLCFRLHRRVRFLRIFTRRRLGAPIDLEWQRSVCYADYQTCRHYGQQIDPPSETRTEEGP